MATLFPESPVDPLATRRPEHSVDPLFVHRWSPRAFVREALPVEVLETIFEAARWAPSSRNEQPWRFVWAMPEDPERETFEGLLTEGNAWAKNASVLAFLFAKRRFSKNDKENRVALFDCGSAWMSLTLQARRVGLYTHAMAGIHLERTYEALGVPESDFQAIVGIAIGRYGDEERVPEGKRVAPTSRNPVGSFAFRGRYGG